MTPETIALIVILAIALVLLIGAYICYSITFKRKKEGPDDPFNGLDMPGFGPFVSGIHAMIRKLQPIPYEDVYIKSHDGLKLHARYYHKVDGAPIIIKVHGYNGCPTRDFCGGGVEALDKVYNVLLLDQRAHEYSEGKTTCFGIKEKYDVRDWAKYLVKRFGKKTKIVIYGISMGAATVLMVSGMKRLPKNIVGVMADCSYTSPKDIIIKVATKDMHIPGKLCFPLIWLGARIFGRFNLTSDSPVKAVRRNKLPLLIVHGLADTFVPPYMSKKIYEEATTEDKKLLLFKGAGHRISYMNNRDVYIAEMEAFLSKTTGYKPNI